MAAQRALGMPAVPRRIGLVSATEGAGRADVIEVLRRSAHAFEVVEARAAMSGPTAPAQVARALSGLCAQGVEVIVLARAAAPGATWSRSTRRSSRGRWRRALSRC